MTTKKAGLKRARQKPLRISQVMVVRPPRRSPVDIAKWRSAMLSADRGRRAALYDLYDDLLIDGVLANAVDRRIMKIANSELLFQKDGKPVDAMVDFIDDPHFEKLLREVMLTKFYGKTVLELDFKDGFKVVNIKRHHLQTKRREILKEIYDDTGVPYYDNAFLLDVGENDDLGLFLKTAPYVIYKRNGMGDFAQFCELYGIDTLVGYYDPEDDKGREEIEKAMKERGSAGSVTMSNTSKIETVGTKSPGTVDIHDRFLKHCDEQILITVLGQTMTTKDGSSLSQSKTHADTEDDINQADKRFTLRILNNALLPRLEKRGYPVSGGRFQFAEKRQDLDKEAELEIAKEVQAITGGVDENYWFEHFGIPKAKQQKKKAEPTEKPQGKQALEARKDARTDEPEKKDLSNRLKRFFGVAPR